MTIPTISTLPTAPARTDPPATFVTRADSFLAALVVMQGELNTSIGAMNTDIAQANTDATAAAASASAAATSESNASTSESNAATSESNAASSAAAAASSYDQFDDRYLGSKASDPAVDNDGNALLTGALYFNSTSDDMKVYTGSTWKVTGFNPDSPTFTDTVTAPSFDLNSIAATNADTATDVFVYDTRKDSDGGAWRKRTQHTSWYNETLNTATRGSRKEFPAVAVIVAESTQVTIYDGDDPDMPMWMVFDVGTSAWGSTAVFISTTTVTSVSMVNSALCVGGSLSPITVNFISEIQKNYRPDVGPVSHKNSGQISLRNNPIGQVAIGGAGTVNEFANDVAMTVLPNAPIDAATGLPVPTIAVATAGGVSVIKDDGAVVDITGGIPNSISFTKENRLFFDSDIVAGGSRAFRVLDIPSVDTNLTLATKPSGSQYYTTATFADSYPEDIAFLNGYAAKAVPNAIGFRTGTSHLALIAPKPDDNTKAMIAFVTSNYNTGWMNGDIKLATLSDTDDTNLTGGELVTNGTFDTDITGWTNQSIGTGSISWDASGAISLNNPAGNTSNQGVTYQDIITVVGKQYRLTLSKSGGNSIIQIGTPTNSNLYYQSTNNIAAQDESFIATTTTTRITLRNYSSSTPALIDDVSLFLLVEDRSVNNNGLQVFGTIIKNPVATGADLVGYTGWTGIQYLEQPYNSDLDFGTGDFSVMCWINTADNYATILDNRSANNSTGWGLFTTAFGSTSRPYIILAAQLANSVELPQIVSGTWTHIVAQRVGTVVKFYVNGALADTNSTIDWSTISASKADTAPMRIGVRKDGSQNLGGSLALLRISATAPTAEQIAKIYEDEKVLFQENSQATLYGSSDAVTALAYDDDTELLHVGTSAGRSVFQGLRRVDNTTGAVGAAISASNGLVAED